MRPRILLATTRRWFAPARLCIALAKSGFEVHAVCPHGHALAETSAISRTHPYWGLAPLRSFQAASRKAQPDLIIPCDDLATEHLHCLYEIEKNSGDKGVAALALLKRSLGEPLGYPLIKSRASTMALAREEQIPVPDTSLVAKESDLAGWLAKHGLPAVLKTDGSSGGVGVRIVRTASEARIAFRELSAPPLVPRVVKRAVVDHDYSLIMPCILRDAPQVSIQRFVSGPDACSALACWEGKVLASIDVEVLETWKTRGPAAVVRLIDHPEMREAAKKMARRLGLSGLFGFDFILDDRTGAAQLIEINPRATQTAHLPLGPGKDLAAALYSVMAQRPLRAAARVTEKDVIALFPQQWQNDPGSELLQCGYHDVPWEEPGLVRACIQSREREAGWLSYENWLAIRSKFSMRRT